MNQTYEKLSLSQFPISIKRFVSRNSLYHNHIHWHEEIEILYFTHGSAVTMCNLEEYNIEKGDIVFVNGQELHAGVVSRTDTVFYCIHINTNFFNNFFESEYIIFENIIRDKECSDILDEIIRKSSAAKPGFKNIIENKKMLYDFFNLLADKYVKAVLSESDYKKQFKKLDKFNVIIEYIDKHYDDDLSVPLLSEHFFMSQSYFAHFFKDKAKMSVMQYINESRIRHAKLLLGREDSSVGEIACRVGYNDINYFSRKFKAIVGMTPTEYKRLYANETHKKVIL